MAELAITTIRIPTIASSKELARHLLKVCSRLLWGCRGTRTLALTFALATPALAFAFASLAFTFAFALTLSTLDSRSAVHESGERRTEAFVATALYAVTMRALHELFDDTIQVGVTPIWMVQLFIQAIVVSKIFLQTWVTLDLFVVDFFQLIFCQGVLQT